jgi:diphthine synthase
MTFYLIGLGLNHNSVSKEAQEVINKADRIYLETYTVGYPYKIEELEESIGRKVERLTREPVEKEEFLLEARTKNVALLVYGSPLSATTHNSLIERCVREKITYKIFYNGSVLDGVAETGLQLYKFGKTASMPKWIAGKYEPESFAQIIKENQKIKAHTLLLIDIGLAFEKAMEQLMQALKNTQIKTDDLVICSRLGTNDSKIIVANMDRLMTFGEVKEPFCIIISSDLHFTEEEALEKYRHG